MNYYTDSIFLVGMFNTAGGGDVKLKTPRNYPTLQYFEGRPSTISL